MRSTGWSLEIGRLFGIPIRVHLTFFVLVVWFGFASVSQGAGFVDGAARIILVFASVGLHELGHALAARRFGVGTIEIVLYPIGGVARLRGMPHGIAELVIAAAGPAVNLVLALVLFMGAVALGQTLPVTPEGWMAPGTSLMLWLSLANVMLFLFNLLPAFPMDGGRILRAFLTMVTDPVRGTRVAAALGQSFAILFGIFGIFISNLVLMIIAVFIFFGAGQEALISRRQAWLQGRQVRDAMITRFERLAPQESFGRAAQLLLRTTQDIFPVVDGWGRVGMVLTRDGILRGLQELGPDGALLEIEAPPAVTVGPDDDLGEIVSGAAGMPLGTLLVADETGVVGMVTPESLANLVAILSRMSETGP